MQTHCTNRYCYITGGLDEALSFEHCAAGHLTCGTVPVTFPNFLLLVQLCKELCAKLLLEPGEGDGDHVRLGGDCSHILGD